MEPNPDPDPFDQAPPLRVKIESYTRPQARDFPTFGYGSVANSIQSLHKDDGKVLVDSNSIEKKKLEPEPHPKPIPKLPLPTEPEDVEKSISINYATAGFDR